MNIFTNWFFVILPALLTTIAFVFTNLTIVTRWVLTLGITSGYFLVMTLLIQRKYKNLLEANKSTLEVVTQNNETIIKYEKFVHSRKLFRTHELTRINSIVRENYSFLRDKYRGKKHEAMVAESKLIKDEIEQIINKEERLFDDQLFDIQSHKNN